MGPASSAPTCAASCGPPTASTRSSPSTTCPPASGQPRRRARRRAASRARSSTRRPRRGLPGADAVVHLAARPSVPAVARRPDGRHDANATGTLAGARGGPPARATPTSSSRRRRRSTAPTRTLPKHEDLATRAAEPVRGQQAGHRVVRAGVRALVRPAGARVPVLQRLRPAAGGRPRLRRRRARLRRRRAARAGRSPCTATARRPATSPTWARWPGARRRRSRAGHLRGPVNLAFGDRAPPCSSSSPLVETSWGTPVERRAHRGPRRATCRTPRPTPPGSLAVPRHRPRPLVDGLHATVDWFRNPDAWASTGTPA